MGEYSDHVNDKVREAKGELGKFLYYDNLMFAAIVFVAIAIVVVVVAAPYIAPLLAR